MALLIHRVVPVSEKGLDADVFVMFTWRSSSSVNSEQGSTISVGYTA
jgi:hypothetical protein